MKHICENPDCSVVTPHTLCHSCWEKSVGFNCGCCQGTGKTFTGGLCTACVAYKTNSTKLMPPTEDDGEITLYESSLGWFPFKE